MRKKFNFDDLEFSPISDNPFEKTQKASLSFSNDYGCNIYFHSPNTNRENPYEFELLKFGKPTGHHKISDENVGYCSKDDICEFIAIAQNL